MASTASTSLRMELMAQGENDGTWGNKLVTSMSILDDAIAGTHAIATTGGTTTIADVNYTIDDAKHYVLGVTGALVSDATIVIPNRTRVFMVANGTTNAFSVFVKTASGTAIEIPQGSAAQIYCNGGNVLRFITPPSVLITGAPGLSEGAAASAVSVSPAGDLTSTNMQAALAELQADIDAIEADIDANYQPLADGLTDIAGLTMAKGSLIVGLNASTWAAEAVGTNGKMLVAKAAATNGVTWANVINAGDDWVFYEAAAPTGWTTSSSADYALRVVAAASTGGTSGGTTAFSSVCGSRTIAQANLPAVSLSWSGTSSTDGAHTHTYARPSGQGDRFAGTGQWRSNFDATGTTGSSGSHSHTASGSTSSINGGVTQSTWDFAVRYYNMLICSKDAY